MEAAEILIIFDEKRFTRKLFFFLMLYFLSYKIRRSK